MSFFKKLFSSNQPAQAVKFLRKQEAPGAIYEIYQGSDAESAKTFLLTKQVTENGYYILVETPEGAWGIDRLGLYLEHLLPFQKDVQEADCDGEVCTIDFMTSPGFEMAANGINESFVIGLKCGKCQKEWLDAVRYQDLTAVRCPNCKAINRIDTRRFGRITTAPYPLFDRFLEFVGPEERTVARKAMASNSMPSELLAVYASAAGFVNAMDFAKTLPRNFLPILARVKTGGALYIRGGFMNEAEFNTIVTRLKLDSVKFEVDRK